MMSDKGLNLFDECAAECVHLLPQEEQCLFNSKMYNKMDTPGTIANSQRMLTKINKKWCYK